MLERKMNNIAATGAHIIATGNPGCMMQIALGARERGMDLQVMHPIELLDEAYRAGGLYDLSIPAKPARPGRQRRMIAWTGAGVFIVAALAWRWRRRRRRKIKG